MILAIYAEQLPDWSHRILTQLEMRGYPYKSFDTISTLIDLTMSHPVVVITWNAKDSLSLAHALNILPASHYRPVHLRIAYNVIAESVNSHADIICLPIPHIIEMHLQTLLRLYEQQQTLCHRIELLEREVTRMTEIVEKQQRSGAEIEVIKNAIVRNVSHELKTPLLHVKSAVSLMAEDIANTKLADYAKDATGRLETLVKNITLLGSSLDTNLNPVIVRDCVEYAKRNLGRIWEHRKDSERIKLDIENNLPPVLADKQGLSTVLQLLMDNALKFSERPIEIVVRRKNDAIKISVKDQGIGIAEDQLGAIFDLFYQIDHSSTRRYGGVGVGLAIVRLILDHHQTKLEVETQPGEGSTFSFELPAVRI